MNKKIVSKVIIFLLILFPLTITDCEKKNEKPKVKDYYIIDVQGETDWDYWVIGNEGGSFLLQLQNSLPSMIYFKPLQSQEGYPIYFDKNGQLSKAIIEDHVFLFGNFRKSLMDIAVVLPNGEIKLFRDIPTDYDLTSSLTKAQNSTLSDILRISSRVISVAACGAGIAAAPATGGLSIALTAVGCGAIFVQLVADIFPKDLEVLGLTASEIGTAAKIVNCATLNIPSCLIGTASSALSFASLKLDEADKRKTQIETASIQLKTGLKVTTSPVTEFSNNSATIGGNIFADGTAVVLERGVYYGVSQNPETTGTKKQNGSGTGSFSSSISNLTAAKTYYVKAYATNTSGIAYGNQASFTTLNNSGTIPTNGLVAYYPFNGNANDQSGNNNNGTVHGATLSKDRHGIANRAYLFDGIDNYIEINHSSSLNLSQQISISFWAKFETSAPYYYPYHIIGKYGCWGIGQRESDIHAGITTSAGDLGLWSLYFDFDRFYHIVMTYDASNLRLYVDGTLKESIAATGLLIQNSNNIFISKYQLSDSYYFFDGVLDDFRIYNRALTQQEITSLSNE